jgi:hypothetical protein
MSRNSRRRRNFFLEDAEDYLEPVDAFSNPDLDSRVQIFSSEAQVPPEDVCCRGTFPHITVIRGAMFGRPICIVHVLSGPLVILTLFIAFVD